MQQRESNMLRRMCRSGSSTCLGVSARPLAGSFMGLTGGLGHRTRSRRSSIDYGELALQLADPGSGRDTAAESHVGLNLMKFRRAIGVLTFCICQRCICWSGLFWMCKLLSQIWGGYPQAALYYGRDGRRSC